MAAPQTGTEPPPDKIASAIHLMISALKLIKGMPGLPFAENVNQAIAAFDKPELRDSLTDRLYNPGKYATRLKRYRILKPIYLGFVSPRDQFDVKIDPAQELAKLESDGTTIWVVRESITMGYAIGQWLNAGLIEEIPPKEG